MGGHQVINAGGSDDGFDEEGYDESQRAEILEATRTGPTDGLVLTDLDPDLGDDDAEDEPIDDLDMENDEIGVTDATVPMAQADIDEDDAQEGFEADDDDEDDDDDDLTDADDVAIKP